MVYTKYRSKPWSKSFRKRGSISRYAKMSKPTADNQKKQIVALAGQVQHLRSNFRLGRQISQYQFNYAENIAADYNCFDIIQPTAWTNIFADPDAVENATRVIMKHLKFDALFTCNTEQGPIQFSCFLVTLKPDTADQVLSIAGSGLTGLVNGAHFCKGATYSGLVHLNEQFFTIRKSWRFVTTAEMMDTSADPSKEASQSMKRISFNFPFVRSLHSGRNAWRQALTSDRVASSAKLYLLMFNNNSALDLEYPFVSVNCVIKCESF